MNTHIAQQQPKDLTPLDRNRAIRIATEQAAHDYGSLETYTPIPCEQSFYWRVFLNSSSPQRPSIEYVIDTRSGQILKKIEFRAERRSEKHKEMSTSKVGKEAAIAITKKDASSAYSSLDHYELTVCELPDFWRIVYSPQTGLDGGGPEYLIDKATGQIVDKKYYQ